VLLVFAAPSQILSLARREERGRTIPLAEVAHYPSLTFPIVRESHVRRTGPPGR
jgi:hypothetical protein